ncbi:MAG: aldo/keto reductase [Victivallales bacterium]|nr:aldo/keto reductase [Victivallales bacterium]
MSTITLGRTNLTVNRNGFGALPIQRISHRDAVALLQKAYDHGIDFYDTARGYSDSEEKIGAALHGVRDRVVIATKTLAVTVKEFRQDLETSLTQLQTDYIDLYQLHNPAFCPRPGDQSGLYDALLTARQQGKIRFIGITNHRLPVAEEAVASELYDTLQFPFSYLSSEVDMKLAASCRRNRLGFIAMKALSGGLITDSAAAYAFMAQFDHVLPIWGIQKEHELDEFLAHDRTPPALTAAMQAKIAQDRRELSGSFCRGCGYCMPCPMGIEIYSCARMGLLLRRAPYQVYLTDEWREKMAKVKECIHCNQCVSRCPYKLNPPEMIQKGYEDYRSFQPPSEQ